mmetsp:Transcript_75349/g.140516  ORF Transcript_75349/g.140516 Transcript_75349/m.140516 type:complete len:243 (+) Transcript_75349:60-788(+)
MVLQGQSRAVPRQAASSLWLAAFALAGFVWSTSLPLAWTVAGGARSPLPARRSLISRTAEESTPAAPQGQPLVGSWRYIGGVYEIKEQGDKLIFQEHVAGELQKEDDWYVAELPNAGTIQLRSGDGGAKVISRFKPAGSNDFGDELQAVREWDTIERRAKSLDDELRLMEFEATVAGVTVVVDGQQRPTKVEFTDEAAKAEELGSRIQQAHDFAVEKSMDAMTEKLRRLYTSHLMNQDIPAR